MEMMKTILTEIFTIPQAACDSTKANWQQVVQMISHRLETKFGEAVQVKHIEFMSDEWFKHSVGQQLLEKEEVNFPFVLVNGELACADKKINISKINKSIMSIINK
ncbi:MAG: hypothetical protein U5K32_11615 [Bacteroidales bacterium]|nr:hypothetical protein [Bacteroidales bacterium]